VLLMNQSKHDHHHHHDHQHHEKPPRQFHKDWRVWTAVILILAAMAAYVLTNEEVLPFGRSRQKAAPTEPAK